MFTKYFFKFNNIFVLNKQYKNNLINYSKNLFSGLATYSALCYPLYK